ncbi:MAG: hypothetical protein DCC55_35645 [Chloroflexi bacterium]|nr:nucleotidyltransferase domain-containing protein [Anaerolineae bacterium]RIK33078.1 MAG: hypothetical protein DCC55_35645 [Chloroflexota bacterium]
MGIDEVIGDKRQAVIDLAAKHGASNVRVVGSVARGQARPDSDVDLLMTIPSPRSVFDLVGLWLDMKDLLGREVSLIPDSAPDREFMRSVLEDAVPL